MACSANAAENEVLIAERVALSLSGARTAEPFVVCVCVCVLVLPSPCYSLEGACTSVPSHSPRCLSPPLPP